MFALLDKTEALLTSVTPRTEVHGDDSGSWKRLGGFDAADDDQAALVMDAAEDLVKTLHNSEDPRRCPTMRISIDDSLGEVLLRWDLTRGWYDAHTGRAV